MTTLVSNHNTSYAYNYDSYNSSHNYSYDYNYTYEYYNYNYYYNYSSFYYRDYDSLNSICTDSNNSIAVIYEDYGEKLRQAVYYSNKFIWPVLLIIGTASNILTLILFSRKSLRDSVTSILLRVLAVVDICALHLLMWPSLLSVNGFGFENLRHSTVLICKIFTFAEEVIKQFATGILVIISIERCIGVFMPLEKRYLVTRTIAKNACLGLLLLIIAANIPVAVKAKIYDQHDVGHAGKIYMPMRSLNHYCGYDIPISWLLMTLNAIAPASCLLILNTAIIIRLVQQFKNRKLNLKAAISKNKETFK